MFATKMYRSFTMKMGRRLISQSTIRLESKASGGTKDASSKSSTFTTIPSHSESVVGPRMITPSDFDKWILVWMKKFPKGQVPKQIRVELMYQTKSRARVKAANYMTAGAVLCCIITAIIGKRASKSGDSIYKRNLEWHKKVQDDNIKEQSIAKS